MKIKLFIVREIQYFELWIFSFNSYVYNLTGFSALTRVFILLNRANLQTRAFSLLTLGFELVTRRFELVTRGFELVTSGFELVTRGFELVTRNSCFTFRFISKHLLCNVLLNLEQFFRLAQKTRDQVPQDYQKNTNVLE